MPSSSNELNPRMYSDARLRDLPFVHTLHDTNWGSSLNSYAPSSPTLSNLSPNHSRPEHLHLFPTITYPTSSPCPPIAHKVWILDCKSCNTFLTNRGMKAVLLLRPNVSLYSSDALPVNCSAYTAGISTSKIPYRPSSSPIPPRTCECLTQTLYCHGCGTTVGYMIAIPCVQCTSSITAPNRATNGHRFVFHSSEVNATERRWIADEPGVNPYDPVSLVVYPDQSLLPPYPGSYRYRSRSSSPAPPSDPLSTPSPEFSDPARLRPTLNTFYFPRTSTPIYLPPFPFDPHSTYTPFRGGSAIDRQVANSSSESRSFSSRSFAYGTAETKDQCLSDRLKPGDVLYWHHLSTSGELPGATDDQRARERQPNSSNVTFDR